MKFNNKYVVGYIPEKVKYFYTIESESSVGPIWEINEKVKAYPIYVLDEKNTATSIAHNYARATALNSKIPQANITVTEEVKNNNPITNLRLLSISPNSNGVSYKFLIDNKYTCYLKDDVVSDILSSCGVRKGGKVNGKFIWAYIYGKIRLIRKDSALHKLILEYNERKNLKHINNKDLVVGDVYQNKKKEKFIFLGFVNSTEYYKNISTNKAANFKFNHYNVKNEMMFLPLYNPESISSIQKNLKKSYSCARVTNKISLVEKIGAIKLPKNAISLARDAVIKEMKNYILNYSGQINNSGYKISSFGLELQLKVNSKAFNAYKVGTKAIELFDPSKYMLFT